MSKGRKKVRAARHRGNRVFIGVWVPESMAVAVDRAVRALELNRAEFLRSALEDKIGKERG